MSDEIRMSGKHGLNPTILQCAWCGEPKNEVAILGELPGDKKAPMYSVLDYEPCDKCKEMWNQGVACFEVTDAPESIRPALSGNWYPTGRYSVITCEAAHRIFEEPYEKGQRVMLDEETYNQLFIDGGDEE